LIAQRWSNVTPIAWSGSNDVYAVTICSKTSSLAWANILIKLASGELGCTFAPGNIVKYPGKSTEPYSISLMISSMVWILRPFISSVLGIGINSWTRTYIEIVVALETLDE